MAYFRCGSVGGYTKCTIVGSLRCRGIVANISNTSIDRVAINQTQDVTIVIDLIDGSYTINGNTISRKLSSGTYEVSGGATLKAGSSGYFNITSITLE